MQRRKNSTIARAHTLPLSVSTQVNTNICSLQIVSQAISNGHFQHFYSPKDPQTMTLGSNPCQMYTNTPFSSPFLWTSVINLLAYFPTCCCTIENAYLMGLGIGMNERKNHKHCVRTTKKENENIGFFVYQLPWDLNVRIRTPNLTAYS